MDSRELNWIPADENPWGVDALDVRPVTLGTITGSQNEEAALNAMSYGRDDGTGFIGASPKVDRTAPTDLIYMLDGILADGALFVPAEMEHKWAIYHHGGKIYFVRSWTRAVTVVADVTQDGDGRHARVTAVHGTFTSADEPAEFTIRCLDYLIRSHALDLIWPAPLPPALARDPQEAAKWCMACFGSRALAATPHDIPFEMPERPLRSYSLLHFAAARGDLAALEELLAAGLPATLQDRDGLTPLHWSVAHEDPAVSTLLLDLGTPVDARSEQGATPLMNAVQPGHAVQVALLLDRGADVRAADERGFTALHRAAEMGHIELVRELLSRGADPAAEADGHTARSLAVMRQETGIVELFDGLVED